MRTSGESGGRWLRRAVRYGTYVALGGAAGVAAYRRWLRPMHQRWGASDAEVAARMPGDDLVRDPMEVTTRAVTVDAGPEHIWPWLLQMGYRRGGLYSYDWIDRLIGALDRDSAAEVLPQFQELKKGDVVPYAAGTEMTVEELVPQRALVLAYRGEGAEVSQCFGLSPIDGSHTRLVLRVRARLGRTAASFANAAVIEPAEFFMVRRQLLGIQERAEALARRGRAERALPVGIPAPS